MSNSSGGSGPDASFDAGTFDASFTDDAPVDATPAADVGPLACVLDAGLPDGACNDLTNLGATVTGTCPAGAQPVGTGGTVVSGTYALTAQARYENDACAPATFQATMVIDGTCSDRVDGLPGSALQRDTTFETNGNVLTRTAVCGAALPAATYTATSTQITIFDEGGSVTTWTMQ